MRSDRCGAFVVNVAFVGSFLCFDIEIPEHFNVVDEEPDRADDHIFDAILFAVSDHLVNVRLCPLA